MGSGISITHKQATEIVKRDLLNEFNEKQSNLPLYTDDGYIIYRDFSEETELKSKIKEINDFIREEYKK